MNKVKTDTWNKLMALMLVISGIWGICMSYHWSRLFYAMQIISAIMVYRKSRYIWISQICMASMQLAILIRYFVYQGNSFAVIVTNTLMVIVFVMISIWFWRRGHCETVAINIINRENLIVIVLTAVCLVELMVLHLWYFFTWQMGIMWLGMRIILYVCLLVPYIGIIIDSSLKKRIC